MNEKSLIIIRKTKIKPILSLLFFAFVSSMFLYASISILLKDKHESSIEVIFSILIILLFLFIIYKMINPLIKLFSNLPEFEISQTELIIYDNPNYKSVLFSDLIGCDIFYLKYSTIIGLFLREDSPVIGNISNFRWKMLNIPKHVKKAIFLDLEFAKIKPKELKQIIIDRIEKGEEK